ncbi:hypothetical protein V8D89_006730 [Ganoderma adspersum]
MTSIANIAMVGAVNLTVLARLTDTPSILPGAFYACTGLFPGELLRGLLHADRTVEYLSTDDLQRCLEGRRTLAIKANPLPTRIFASTPAAGCSTPAHCQAWFQCTLVAM